MPHGPPHIVVVGASAGGVEALQTLVAGLPATLNAAVFIVLHIPAHTHSYLGNVLNAAAALPVTTAIDGEAIQCGRVYVAPTGHHLMVEHDLVRLTFGPREGRSRPSIDVLFRSAAAAYGDRVIGVVLTGMLDDGTAGLWSIKDQGGRTLVQDPATAQFPSMPQSAITHVAIDAVLPLESLAAAIDTMTRTALMPAPRRVDQPKGLQIENLISREGNGLAAGIMALGKLTPYTCPECHGVLVQIQEGRFVRFRCHTGHAYSLRSLLADTNHAISAQLWDIVRVIEESIMLTRQMAGMVSDPEAAARYTAHADESARRLKPLHAAAVDPLLVGAPVLE